jgi:hypothetical protein
MYELKVITTAKLMQYVYSSSILVVVLRVTLLKSLSVLLIVDDACAAVPSLVLLPAAPSVTLEPPDTLIRDTL